MRVIDLRRDTITLPTETMKKAAFQAKLGDSVYGEDPDQERLERRAAEISGKEAAIFLPSGTMGNLVALLTHTERGQELILEATAHIRTSESGGAANVAGLMIAMVPGPSGCPTVSDVAAAIRKDDIHYPRTGLICLESSHYRYGGIVAPLSQMKAVFELAQERGIPLHLDGARLFNAASYLGVDAAEICDCVDSVMFSLSKGLAAPVGSMLCGTEKFIERAKRFRKMLGGGMRQTGWLCAAGVQALEPENIKRIGRDNENARKLAEGLNVIPGISVDVERVHTNFVDARLIAAAASDKTADGPPVSINAAVLAARLKEKGILVTPRGDSVIRMVTSRMVNSKDIDVTVAGFRELFS